MARRKNLPKGLSTVFKAVVDTFEVIYCVYCEPLIKKLKARESQASRKRREKEFRKRQFELLVPIPLGVRMERNLTIGRELIIDQKPSVKGSKGGRKLHLIQRSVHETTQERMVGGWTCGQLDSWLFKFPAEIRAQIWEEVLGGNILHITFDLSRRRMIHKQCREVCPWRQYTSSLIVRTHIDYVNVRLLSILLSCRRMYVFYCAT